MGAFRVMVTDDRHGRYDEERAVLAKLGAELEIHNLNDQDEAETVLAEADGVLVNLFPITAPLIASMKRCRVISRYGVGCDNVDLEAAEAAGIRVTRVPDYCVEEVSDHAMALLLDLARGLSRRDRALRAGQVCGTRLGSHRMRGRVLGILGYGLIGRAFHRKAAALNPSRVLIHDVRPGDGAETGVEAVSLRDLLAASDYLSIHIPLNEQTHHILGREEFAAMKPGSLLVNTSRGAVIDQTALIEALETGTPAGAGLDVFETEPLPPDSPLLTRDDVVLSDHAGWYSEESLAELKTRAAENVASVLSGKRPPHSVV